MNHETLWAREGDLARKWWLDGMWSPFSSRRTEMYRSEWRTMTHGFDFRVESVNGTKTMVKEEAP